MGRLLQRWVGYHWVKSKAIQMLIPLPHVSSSLFLTLHLLLSWPVKYYAILQESTSVWTEEKTHLQTQIRTIMYWNYYQSSLESTACELIKWIIVPGFLISQAYTGLCQSTTAAITHWGVISIAFHNLIYNVQKKVRAVSNGAVYWK